MYRQKREQTYFTLTGLLSYDDTLFDNLNLPNSLDKDTCVTEILMTCGLLEVAYPDGDIMKQIINVWSYARKPDWQRMIDALYGEYNPLHNYDRREDFSTSGTSTEQRGLQKTGQFTGTDVTDDVNVRTLNTTDTRTDALQEQRTDNLTETKNGGETTTHQNTAYNAGLSDTSRDILVRNGDATTNTGTQTTANTGTQTYTHSGTIADDRDITVNKSGMDSATETENASGSNSQTHNLYARGNIGVMSTQELIKQEIEVRYKFNIYEIIAREFKEKFCNLVYIL